MSLIEVEYNRANVINYASKWAFSRNPAYYNFDNVGGDCTSFASQCLYAGCKVMNYKPVLGWYYINANRKSPSWSGVPYFYNFLTSNDKEGPSAVSCDIENLQIGDFIQLGDINDDFYHTLVVVRIDGVPSDDTIFIATHTYDSYNKVLSSYYYNKIRYLHIDSVKKWV